MTLALKPPAMTAPISARATIQCFSRFKVLAPDGTEIKWRTSKSEELLAYLAHHRGEAVNRLRIMDALWGNDSKSTTAYLNTTAYYLRGSLNSAGITNVLEHNRGFYRIRMEAFDSQLLSFEQALLSVGSVHVDESTVWEKAANLYSGGYLAENDYSWPEQRRSLLENRYVELVLRISGYYKEAGQQDAAIKLLKKAMKQVSWIEAIHTELILAFLANRDRLGALKQYDALKRMLRREYSAEPGDDIKRLLHLRC